MKHLLSLLIICIFTLVLMSCSESPEASFTWSPREPVAGQEVQFTNTSIGARSYSWNLGNMKISSETNPVNIYEREGNYIVSLTAHKGLRSHKMKVTINVLP